MIEADLVALEGFSEIGAHVIKVDRRAFRLGARVGCDARLDEHERIAGHDGLADLDRNSGDGTCPLRRDDVLHLHRLEHQQLPADRNDIARRDVDRHDGALHRRRDGLHCLCLACRADS